MENVDKEKISTRAWAQMIDYEPSKIFHKLFHDDIKYLLSMQNLWEKRRPPTPLKTDELPDAGKSTSFLFIYSLSFIVQISTLCPQRCQISRLRRI